MSRRRRPVRVPPTYATRVADLLAVATEHVEPGGVYTLRVEHDDGCPAIVTQRLGDCRCSPQLRPPRRLA